MAEARGLTTEVVEFVTRTRYEDIPEEVRALARRCILDGLGVTLAGAVSEGPRILQRWLEDLGMQGPSAVFGTRMRAQPPFAALANGTAGHALDYDDTQLASSPDRVYGLLTHPTVPVLSAVLALGQAVGASGREVLASFCVGVEVECKLAETAHPRHYVQGFHSTGTFGTLGSAMACAHLLRLPPRQVRMALGIAVSRAGGIRCNFGTMTKPLHAGLAGQNGLESAQLASLGFTADPDALDGPWGFFQVTAGGADPQFLVGKLGNPWALVHPGVSIKPYPCGSLAHPAMDALRDLVQEHDLQPEQVEEVRVGTTRRVLEALRYQRPTNALEAKFSLPFMMACLVLYRRAGLREFRDEVVRRPEVQAMMERVHPYLHEEIDAEGYALIRALVEVRLRDGTVLARRAEVSRGTPQRPMTQEELREKVRECAEEALPPERVGPALEVMEGLEGLPSLEPLASALTP